MPFTPVDLNTGEPQAGSPQSPPAAGFRPVQTGQTSPQIKPLSKEEIQSRFDGKQPNIGAMVGKSLKGYISGEKPFRGSPTIQEQAIDVAAAPFKWGTEMLGTGARMATEAMPSQGIAGALTSPLRAFTGGVEAGIRGAGAIGTGISEAAKGITTGEGERILTGLYGEAIPGAFQVAGAPIAGTIGVAPDPVKQAAVGVAGAFEALPRYITEEKLGIEPGTELHKGMMGATSFIQDALLGAAGKGASALAKSKYGTWALTKVDDAAQYIDDFKSRFSPKTATKVLDKYKRSIKPHLPGKTTPTQAAKYDKNALLAVDTLTDMADDLELRDIDGNILEGATPRSVKQFGDAIGQGKKKIHAEYNQLATQAGEKGAVIGLDDLKKELLGVKNKKSLQVSNPSAVAYADDMLKRIDDIDELDVMTAQDLVQEFNNNAQSFYRNPDPNAWARANVDAMVANNLRKSLDDSITKSVGGQYQGLRNRYSALKAIEQDVMKAFARVSRKNAKGLPDLVNVFNAGDVAYGITSMSPQVLSRAGTQSAMVMMYKYLTDPDRGIQSMFDTVVNQKRKALQGVTGPVRAFPGQGQIGGSFPGTVGTIGAVRTPLQEDQQ